MNCLFYFPEVPLLLLVFLMCFAFLFLLVTIHHFKGVKNPLWSTKPPLLSFISSLFQLTFSQHLAHFCCITDKALLSHDRIYLFPRQSSVPCILCTSSFLPRLLYVPFAIAFSLSRRFFFLILDLVLPIHFDRLCQIKS